MMDPVGIQDVVGVVLTVAVILFAIGWSLKRLYAAQEAEQLGEMIARRHRARHVLSSSPAARTASRK